MLSGAPVSAILPTTDLDRAKDFYQNQLGLKLMDMSMDDPLMFGAGAGTTLVVYHRPQGTKAEHTVAGFDVKDLAAVMRGLESKGIKFEDYPQMEGFDTATHTVSFGGIKSAWFKDPDGNIIAISQM